MILTSGSRAPARQAIDHRPGDRDVANTPSFANFMKRVPERSGSLFPRSGRELPADR